MQPKTIEAYSHGVRRAGEHFDYRIDDLSKDQLTDYFAGVLEHLSWSTLKHDLYGLKFYYAHVLDKPWTGARLTKAPKVSRLPDIVTVAQMRQIVDATRALSYRVFFFALYSMGLRLGEGLRLQVGDIDADRMRVHVRDANADRAHAGEGLGVCIARPGTDQGGCHVNRRTPQTCCHQQVRQNSL